MALLCQGQNTLQEQKWRDATKFLWSVICSLQLFLCISREPKPVPCSLDVWHPWSWAGQGRVAERGDCTKECTFFTQPVQRMPIRSRHHPILCKRKLHQCEMIEKKLCRATASVPREKGCSSSMRHQSSAWYQDSSQICGAHVGGEGTAAVGTPWLSIMNAMAPQEVLTGHNFVPTEGFPTALFFSLVSLSPFEKQDYELWDCDGGYMILD